MDPELIGLIKTSPAIGALLGLAYLVARWVERMQDRCHAQLAELMADYRALLRENLATNKELHQSLGEMTGVLERCKRLLEER